MSDALGLVGEEFPPDESPLQPDEPAQPAASEMNRQPAQTPVTGYTQQAIFNEPATGFPLCVFICNMPQTPLTPQPQKAMNQAQPQIIQAGGSTVVVQTAPDAIPPAMSAGYSSTFTSLGAVQIAMGSLCFLIQFIADVSYLGISKMGVGYLAGGLFILTGVFGVLSGKKMTKAYVKTFLVMSILMASVFVGLNVQVEVACRRWHCYDDDELANFVWYPLMISGGLVDLVNSAYCCRFLWCQKQKLQPQSMTGMSGQPQSPQWAFSGLQRVQQVEFPVQTTKQHQKAAMLPCSSPGAINQQPGSTPGNLADSPPPAYTV